MQINEFKARPNTHQLHFEQLVTQGPDGLAELNDKIEKFLATLEGQDVGLNTTTKIDGCLHPDTLIKTTEGDISIGTLINDRSGKIYTGFGLDNGVVKEVTLNAPRVNSGNKEWLTLEFENGSYITCTEDHMFKVKNGTFKHAFELNIGDEIEELN